MIPQLKEFELFSYRNSYEMANFEITDEFVFICTCDEIHQYSHGSTIPVIGKLGFYPRFNAFFGDKFFIGSKESLYYFKYELYKLGDINSMALCFFIDKYLVTVEGDKNNIQVFKVESDKLCKPVIDHARHRVECNSVCLLHEIELKSYNTNKPYGLCSAYCISGDLLYLGFENGSIVSLDKSNLLKPGDCSFIAVSTLETPVIKLLIHESFMFVLTISGIFKINLNTPECIDYFTSVHGKNIYKFEDNLLLEQENRILIFDFNLNLIEKHVSMLDIKACKITEDSFYIGFSNGLLIQYDVNCLRSHKKVLKDKFVDTK